MIVDYIDTYRDRFGVEPICRVLCEHDVPIAPSTYFARKACPVSDADWDDLFARNDGDESIIPGLAYRGRWTAIASPAKAGKSTVIRLQRFASIPKMRQMSATIGS